MNTFTQFSNQSILMAFIILTLFNIIITASIYFIDRRMTSMYWLMLSNVFHVISLALVYDGGRSGSFSHLPFSTLFGTLQVTAWMLAIHAILSIRPRYILFGLVNVGGLLIALYFFFVDYNLAMVRVVTTLAMIVIEVTTAVLMLNNKKNHIKQKVYLSIFVFGPLLTYHIFRAWYRITQALFINSIFDVEGSVTFFIITGLTLGALINIVIIYMIVKDLVTRAEATSQFDNLTSTLSRSWFFKVFDLKLKEISRYKREYAVALLDLDNFKYINDKFGHRIGDEVLIEFSAFLRNELRDTDIIGRYGGDEFVILLECNDAAELEKVFTRVLRSLSKARFSSKELKLSMSCGVYQIPIINMHSSNELVDIADQIMYKVKLEGKSNIKVMNYTSYKMMNKNKEIDEKRQARVVNYNEE